VKSINRLIFSKESQNMSISNQEIIDSLGNDTMLWNASLKSEAKPIAVLANKLVRSENLVLRAGETIADDMFFNS